MRRMFWMGVGAVAGASGTVWAQRQVRTRLEDLGPPDVVAVAGRGARSLGRTVGRTVAAAVTEGREAMADRETEMRRRMLGDEAVLDLRPELVDPRYDGGHGTRRPRSGRDPAGPRRALGR